MITNKQALVISIKETTLSYKEGETVLDCLERGKVEAQFNCREGFCGVCRTKLLSGQVEYTLDPLAYIDDDEILTCCSVPCSDIEIQID